MDTPEVSARFYPSATSDGQTIAYQEVGDDGVATSLKLRSIDSGGRSRVITSSTGMLSLGSPTISRDGSWLAYLSHESGTGPQIFVRSVRDDSVRRQLTTSGGSSPTWRADGRELFYLSPDGDVMVISIGAGPRLTPSSPTRLFHVANVPAHYQNRWFDVSPDGQSFVFVLPVSDRPVINVILNWQSLLLPSVFDRQPN